MRVLVVGCGSIGTRRAKILHELGHKVGVTDTRWGAGDEAAWRRRNDMPYKFSARRPQAVLICTPPENRVDALTKHVAGRNIAGVFVEKPLAVTEADTHEIQALTWGVPVTMGACNLRFSEGASALRRAWRAGPLYGHFLMGLAAKYWNPAHRPISLILDSIHELDLAAWALGPIAGIRGSSNPWVAKVLATHENGATSVLELDRVADPPKRRASIFENNRPVVSIDVDTDGSMYVRELEHFMRCVETGEQTCNPIDSAADVCRWALEVA